MKCRHIDEHSKGKDHLELEASIVSTDFTNNQQNSNDNINGKQDNTSMGILAEPITESELCTKLQLICKDSLVKDIPNNSEEKEKSIASFNSYEKDDNDVLQIEKNVNSGLFMSSDISMEINKLIKNYDTRLISCIYQKTYEYNIKSNINYYDRIYQKKFLDFEEIMFICNKKELDNIKMNLQFYVPYFDEKMLCLVCNYKHSYNINELYKHIHHEQHITQLTQLRNKCEEFELLKKLIKVMPVKDNKHLQLIQCYACNINWIQNRNAFKINKSRNHTYLLSHKDNRKRLFKQVECMLEKFKTLWYSIEYFACTECDIRFERKIDFMEHLNSNHMAVLNTENNQNFNFCITCATLWYQRYDDDSMNYYEHCQETTHQYLEEKKDFAVMSLSEPLKKLLKNIDEIIADLFEQSNEILNDPKLAQLRDDLKHTFETYQLPVEVCLFGSRVTGLALPNSHFDVYLNFDDECTKDNLITSRYKKIQDCLRADCENWKIEKSILNHSRIPVIKVKHRLMGLQCTISFANDFLVENSKLIKSFNTAYPLCQKLILFLKKWILVEGFTDFEGITSYALTWLVIFYLQVRYKIPSIAALIKSQSKNVSAWTTGIDDIIPTNMPELSIHELLLGFFEYYGNFDYMHCVACPLLGEVCRKESVPEVFLTKLSAFPDAMALYNAQSWSAKSKYFYVDSCMCVQDPFDLSLNLTKAVSVLTLKHFKQYCNESLLELRKLQLPQERK